MNFLNIPLFLFLCVCVCVCACVEREALAVLFEMSLSSVFDRVVVVISRAADVTCFFVF